MAANLPRDEPGRNVPTPSSRRRSAVAEMLAESVGESGGMQRFPVRGDCMTPLLKDGDGVDVTALERPPRLGDLLLADDGRGEIVCHRVLALGPPLELAGDASHRVDRVEPRALIGRVVAVYRGDKRLRIDRGLWHHVAPLLGRWHGAVRRRLGTSPALWLDLPRRALLRLLAFAWLGARPTS